MSEPPPPTRAIRPYLFFDERRPKRTWMPALEAINERFAQFCRAALLQHLQPPLEIEPQFAIEVVKHAEFLDRLPVPSHLTLVTLRPLSGTILIAAEADLVGIIVESRFGGSGRLPIAAVPNREFAPIELHAMSRVVVRLLDQLAAAWRPVALIMPEIMRCETKPAFAAIAASTDLVIVNNFEVKVANGSGKLTIAIPYQLLHPLHDRLMAGNAERTIARDDAWSEDLRVGVGAAAMPLNVELAAIEMTVRDFLSLRPGSVFEIARPDSVTVQAHGMPLFRGRWGRYGHKIAVRVEARLPAAPERGPVVNGSENNDAG
jgi:flagellar motor switch protein FliM